MDPVSRLVIAEGLSQPYLAMFSETWHNGENESFDIFYKNHKADIYQFAIQGTAHFDFTDLPAFSPLAHALGLKGPLQGSRVLEIIKDYTLGFFDQYFKGVPTDLLDGPSDEYPELIWK